MYHTAIRGGCTSDGHRYMYRKSGEIWTQPLRYASGQTSKQTEKQINKQTNKHIHTDMLITILHTLTGGLVIITHQICSYL